MMNSTISRAVTQGMYTTTDTNDPNQARIDSLSVTGICLHIRQTSNVTAPGTVAGAIGSREAGNSAGTAMASALLANTPQLVTL
jgi:hypothetical protein